jgi:hypothetical protein
MHAVLLGSPGTIRSAWGSAPSVTNPKCFIGSAPDQPLILQHLDEIWSQWFATYFFVADKEAEVARMFAFPTWGLYYKNITDT